MNPADNPHCTLYPLPVCESEILIEPLFLQTYRWPPSDLPSDLPSDPLLYTYIYHPCINLSFSDILHCHPTATNARWSPCLSSTETHPRRGVEETRRIRRNRHLAPNHSFRGLSSVQATWISQHRHASRWRLFACVWGHERTGRALFRSSGMFWIFVLSVDQTISGSSYS